MHCLSIGYNTIAGLLSVDLFGLAGGSPLLFIVMVVLLDLRELLKSLP